MQFKINCTDIILDLSTPKVMGILNITPDSFYDGNQYLQLDKAIKRAEQIIGSGADIIDVGGESTRPKAIEISVTEQIDRVIPVIEKIKAEFDVCISIDTSCAKVMQAAVNAGAHIINDVRALQCEGALDTAASLNVPIILMHSLYGTTTHYEYRGNDLINNINSFLKERVKACTEKGIESNQIILDVGFGGGMFGKNTEQNLDLIRYFDNFTNCNMPHLVGISRKGFLGEVTGESLFDRLSSGLTVQMFLLSKGAKLIRTHDVKETVAQVKLYNALS